MHAKFGRGVVTDYEGSGAHARVLVNFEQAGSKWLVLAFANLQAVAEAAGGSFADVVKITIYLTDLSNFGVVNEVMKRCFAEPYPARATVGVRELPRGALVEADLVLVLD